MKLHISRFALIVLVVSACIANAADLAPIVAKGFTHAMDNKKIPYTVEARQGPYKAPATSVKPAFGTNGGKLTPKFICTGLTVSIGGKKMEIPDKAFGDLCDITLIKPPVFEMGYWLLPIKGGHDAGAYEVEYMFNDKRVLERGYLMNVPGPKWLRTLWQHDKF
ncbi:MAG: hypothetical protein ABI443_04040 [Chthoniobacterales bacterium]